jgi:WD40 repeat protein
VEWEGKVAVAISLNAAIVRIRTANDRIVGTGFLVTGRHVLTCAHVIAQALGVSDDVTETPPGEVHLDFPLVAPVQGLPARVVYWQPESDVAGLEILDDPPARTAPVRLVTADDLWNHAFRAFGFPRGYDNGVWASGRILGQEATGWLQIEDVKQTGYFVAPGFSGGPVWDEALDGVVGMTVAADTTGGVRTAFIVPTHRLAAVWPELAMWAIPPCPYRGLLAFREQDAPFFFGREAFTDRLVETVQEHTLTVVIGPSGSGKSSAVFAGLIPRLRQGQFVSCGSWAITHLRPGNHPFDQLIEALLSLLEPAMNETMRLLGIRKLSEALRDRDLDLSHIVDRIVRVRPSPGCLLLVIDQFEELYTLCPEPETRQFLDTLLTAINDQANLERPNLRLVLTLRADFLGQALAYRPFADALDQAEKVMMGPMTSDEIEAAIVCPAEQQRIAFESGLVERILDDVGSEPGSLPLLEFALTQLWEYEISDQLTHLAYESIGEVEGALTRYADQVYTALSKVEREQARWIFVQLVRPGEETQDTRRLATRVELKEANWKTVDKLASARLVVTNRGRSDQRTVEIAHEALIRNWSRLRKWIEEERNFRLWQERLRSSLRQWEANARDEDALLLGVPLAEAEYWLEEHSDDLSPNEQTYIVESIALRERKNAAKRQLRRRINFGLMTGLVVTIVLTLLFWSQRNMAWENQATAVAEAAYRATAEYQALTAEAEAEDRHQEAEGARATAEARQQEATAHQLAMQAELVADQAGELHEVGVLLAVESLHRSYTFGGNQALRNLVALLPLPISEIEYGYNGNVSTVAFESDSRRLVLVDNDAGAMSVYTVGLTISREPVQMTYEGEIEEVAFGPDGQRLVTGSSDGAVRLWEVETGLERLLGRHQDEVWAVAISPDGQFVASGSQGGSVWGWEVSTGEKIFQVQQEWPISELAFSPNGQWLVTGSTDGTTRVWDMQTGSEVNRTQGRTNLYEVAVSPDGQMIISGYGNVFGEFEAVIWDVNSGEEITSVRHEGHSVGAASFSPDGQWVSTVGTDYTARVWNIDTGQEIARVVHESLPLEIAFSSDGQEVISVDRHGVRVWNPYRRTSIEMMHQGVVRVTAFSPDGRWVATSSDDGTARVWEVVTGQEIARVEHRGCVVEALSFSPDGRWIISGGRKVSSGDYKNSALVWEAATGQELARMEHQDGVSAVAFGPDGKLVVSGSQDGTVLVWEAATGQEVARMEHQGGVSAVAFSPNGQWVISGSGDGTARVWEATTGYEIARMEHSGAVWTIAVSPDGRWVASAGVGGEIQVWEATTGQPVSWIEPDEWGAVTTVSFSPDGQWVVGGSERGTIRVWEAISGQEVSRMEHEGSVQSVSVSPDGQWLASAGWDNNQEGWSNEVRVWELGTGQLVSRMEYQGGVVAVAFSPNGQWIAAGGGVGSGGCTVRVWLWQSQDLIAEACSRLTRNLTLEEWEQYIGDESYRIICPNLPVPEE